MKAFTSAKAALILVSLTTAVAGCQNVLSSHEPPHRGDGGSDRPRAHFWHKPHHREIPPEFRHACDGKNIGDSVTITLQNGKQIQGNCELRFKPDFPEQPKAPPANPPA